MPTVVSWAVLSINRLSHSASAGRVHGALATQATAAAASFAERAAVALGL
jgi:hypothetical protein